jgi:hypothetical protein
MEISKKKYNVIFWALISFILIVLIFKWINYLSNNNFIMECFTPGLINEMNDGSTSHTVDLPLTTTYSCQNSCGPTSRCSITGQQCFADIDCPGCQPYSPPLKSTQSSPVPGNNDSGKLTLGVTPQYSPLTSGYGTQETLVTPNSLAEPPPMSNFGVNVWGTAANQEYNLFNKRYKPPQLNYMPNYPQRYSFTGEFIEDGPFASNATLPVTN